MAHRIAIVHHPLPDDGLGLTGEFRITNIQSVVHLMYRAANHSGQ